MSDRSPDENKQKPSMDKPKTYPTVLFYGTTIKVISREKGRKEYKITSFFSKLNVVVFSVPRYFKQDDCRQQT